VHIGILLWQVGSLTGKWQFDDITTFEKVFWITYILQKAQPAEKQKDRVIADPAFLLCYYYRIARLYEQGADDASIGQYVWRWLLWARLGM